MSWNWIYGLICSGRWQGSRHVVLLVVRLCLGLVLYMVALGGGTAVAHVSRS